MKVGRGDDFNFGFMPAARFLPIISRTAIAAALGSLTALSIPSLFFPTLFYFNTNPKILLAEEGRERKGEKEGGKEGRKEGRKIYMIFTLLAA